MVKEKVKTVKKTKKKAMKRTKISWIVKPDGMSLTEWQIALRKQIAQEEHFGISCVDDKLLPGEYSVKSPKTKQEYKVVYRGAKSEWNYCSCFDFKTAQLGTCKHIEAVKLWHNGNRRVRVHQEIPPYTSVFLKYLPTEIMPGETGDVRKVCIRIGSDHQEEYEQLAEKKRQLLREIEQLEEKRDNLLGKTKAAESIYGEYLNTIRERRASDNV